MGILLSSTANTQGKKRRVWEAAQESFLTGFLEEKEELQQRSHSHPSVPAVANVLAGIVAAG